MDTIVDSRRSPSAPRSWVALWGHRIIARKWTCITLAMVSLVAVSVGWYTGSVRCDCICKQRMGRSLTTFLAFRISEASQQERHLPVFARALYLDYRNENTFCPGTETPYVYTGEPFDESAMHFESSTPPRPILWCPAPMHRGHRNVLFDDGRVRSLLEADFLKLLASTASSSTLVPAAASKLPTAGSGG